MLTSRHACLTKGNVRVCVASIVVLVESALFNPQTEELPKDNAAIMIWATVEVNLAIVSGMLLDQHPSENAY